DFTFTEDAGGPTTASGMIDVVGGSAISGFIDVLGGPNSGIYSFILGSGIFTSPSGAFIVDNAVFPGSDPFLGTWGLVFRSGGIEFNLWGNHPVGSPGAYNLDGWNGVYAPEALGTATLTLVPDGGPTVALLGIALTGIAAVARRKART